MPQEEVRLTLTDDDPSPSALAHSTQELSQRLGREPGISARLVSSETSAGSKGDAVTVGAIILSIVGSHGLISSLIDVLKAYVERRPTLAIEFQKGEQKVSLRAENLQPAQLDKTRQLLRRLIDSSHE